MIQDYSIIESILISVFVILINLGVLAIRIHTEKFTFKKKFIYRAFCLIPLVIVATLSQNNWSNKTLEILAVSCCFAGLSLFVRRLFWLMKVYIALGMHHLFGSSFKIRKRGNHSRKELLLTQLAVTVFTLMIMFLANSEAVV